MEKRTLESLFEMGGGYVLDFSNRTFAEFVLDSTRRDIYDDRYAYEGGSKANRLRAFWSVEPNHLAGKLTRDLVGYCRALPSDTRDGRLLAEAENIAERLLKSAPVEDLEAIASDGDDRNFEVLARAVREAIEKDQPEAGLDRLHTYVTKLVRGLAAARGIETGKDKPLHGVFGEYVKALRAAGLLESEMTERILKSSIGTMEAFNRVRNDQSLAHDNPVLNYDESLLIFNHVCSAVRFLRGLEARAMAEAGESTVDEIDDIPF